MKRTLALALLVLLALPASALGHAELLESTPARDAQLERPPRQVAFRFSEPVEASFGAVQVLDDEGKRVDGGKLLRPGGRGDTVAAALPADLGSGTYTATYRVISADSHPVSGGIVFTLGDAAGSAVSVADALDQDEAGPVTTAGFGVIRGLAYAAMAVVLGGLLFVLAVWAPMLRAQADASAEWTWASIAFARRAHAVLAAGLAVGLATSLLGLAFQGAVAGGTSVWAAFDPAVIEGVLDTRFGSVWAARALLWVVLAVVVLWPRSAIRLPALRPARLGADGVAVAPSPAPALLAALAVLAAAIALTPGLAGHAGQADPVWLILATDTLHVLAMCAWIGMLVLLLAALPEVTRRLDPPARTRVLAGALVRVSPIALASVLGLLATGIGQSIAHLNALDDLWDSGYGRAILVKAGLLAALCAIGAYHRRRGIPRLRAIAEAGEPPAGAGLATRRALRAEILLFAGVLAATSVLVATSPASAGPGVLSERVTAGPAEVEVTMEPLRVGANDLHLYLFDRSDGSRLARVREVQVELRRPDGKVGALPVQMSRAGPGHYVASHLHVGLRGEWELRIGLRLSEFDLATARLPVEIR